MHGVVFTHSSHTQTGPRFDPCVCCCTLLGGDASVLASPLPANVPAGEHAGVTRSWLYMRGLFALTPILEVVHRQNCRPHSIRDSITNPVPPQASITATQMALAPVITMVSDSEGNCSTKTFSSPIHSHFCRSDEPALRPSVCAAAPCRGFRDCSSPPLPLVQGIN